jgi:hypothetical protein
MVVFFVSFTLFLSGLALFTNPVYAGLIPVLQTGKMYKSHPASHNIVGLIDAGGVTTPTYAYDKNNGTSASFDYGKQKSTTNYFEVITFTKLTGPAITNVDLRMRWAAVANTAGETYQIEFYVGGSGPEVLVAWTGTSHTAGASPEVWSFATKPAGVGGGAWTWTDIGNIKFRIQASDLEGKTSNSIFNAYEMWVTVTCASSPYMYLDPQNTTDITKVVGSTFTVDVKVGNVSDLGGYEFKVRYDTSILSCTDMAPHSGTTNEAGFIFPTYSVWYHTIADSQGYVWLSVTIPIGGAAAFGSGKLATLTFKVDALGETGLDLCETVLGDALAVGINHDYIYKPTSNSGAWTNGANAYSSDNAYASSGTNGQEHTYGAYGYVGPIGYTPVLAGVEIGLEAYTNNQGKLSLYYSKDGGTSWTSVKTDIALPTFDANFITWYSIGILKASELSDANFKVKVKSVIPGAGNVTYLDYIPIKLSWDGYFRNTAPAVPEFPLGAAVEIALAAVIIHLLWKRKRKTKDVQIPKLTTATTP